MLTYIKSKQYISIIIQMFFCFFIGILVVNGKNRYDNYNLFLYISVISLCLFFITNVYKTISVFTFFVLASYIYNCGQNWLVLFHINMTSSSFLITLYDKDITTKALSFFLLAINLIQLTGLLSFRTEDGRIGNESRSHISDYRRNDIELKYLGIILFIFCLIVLSINDTQQIIHAQSQGYANSYRLGRNNSLIYAAYYLYPLAIIILIITSNNIKIKKILYSYAIIRAFILMLLVGNRGQHIVMLCLLLLLHNNDKSSNKKSYTLKYLIMGLLLIIFIPFVASIRNQSGIERDYLSFLQFIMQNNPLIQLLQELGGTFVDIIMVFGLCPNYLPFGKGISYLASTIGFIPNGSLLIPNWIKYFEIGLLLNNYFPKGDGLGGSYLAEFYYNFGWYSLLIIQSIGIIISKISKEFSSRKISLLKKVIYSYFVYALMMYIRGSFHDILIYIRYLIYALVIYMILKILIRQRERSLISES